MNVEKVLIQFINQFKENLSQGCSIIAIRVRDVL